MHEQNHTLELSFSDSKPRLLRVLKGSLRVVKPQTQKWVWDLVLCVTVTSFKAFLRLWLPLLQKLRK